MSNSQIVITFDTDWVPQFVLDYVLQPLQDKGLPATIFCTGTYTLPKTIERALHPNFMDESSLTPNHVMDKLTHEIPNATGIRTHRFYWHSGFYHLFQNYGIHYDSSLLLPFQSHITPNFHNGLLRIPVWWSEAAHIHKGLSMKTFDLPGIDTPGVKVLLFHPIHIYLNSHDPILTSQNLDRFGKIERATPEMLNPLRNTTMPGIETLYLSALKLLAQNFELTTLNTISKNVTSSKG